MIEWVLVLVMKGDFVAIKDGWIKKDECEAVARDFALLGGGFAQGRCYPQTINEEKKSKPL